MSLWCGIRCERTSIGPCGIGRSTSGGIRRRVGGALARITWEREVDRDGAPALVEAEARVQSAQLAAAVRAAVQGLPPRWRQAFELVREYQLTYAEAAAVLGVTVKSIDTSLGRAVKALRKALGGVWP
jgi:RNA polymerase sigma factor (sigma-70 family)